MSTFLTTFGKLTLPAAALSAAVFGLTGTGMANDTDEAATGPLSCGFEISDSAFGRTLKGTVTANEDIDGRYQMEFTKRGANSATIKQKGNFALDPGESAVLGQASLGGSGQVDAKLTLTIDGETLICRADPIDL